jgi:hypothetical protein
MVISLSDDDNSEILLFSPTSDEDTNQWLSSLLDCKSEELDAVNWTSVAKRKTFMHAELIQAMNAEAKKKKQSTDNLRRSTMILIILFLTLEDRSKSAAATTSTGSLRNSTGTGSPTSSVGPIAPIPAQNGTPTNSPELAASAASNANKDPNVWTDKTKTRSTLKRVLFGRTRSSSENIKNLRINYRVVRFWLDKVIIL